MKTWFCSLFFFFSPQSKGDANFYTVYYSKQGIQFGQGWNLSEFSCTNDCNSEKKLLFKTKKEKSALYT